MAEESEDNVPIQNEGETAASPAPQESQNTASQNTEITEAFDSVEAYFKNNRKLLTVPGGVLTINDDTRRLLALFSDGSFLVSETHKFDGRVLSFEVLARKKKLIIAKPVYVSQNEINAIYNYAERNTVDIEADSDLNALQMQKDFVNLVTCVA